MALKKIHYREFLKKAGEKVNEITILQYIFIVLFVIAFILVIYNPIKFTPDPPLRYVAQIIEKGYINCFPDNMKFETGKPVIAEPSGVVFFHNKLYFVNDSPIPGFPPLMITDFIIPFNQKEVVYAGNDYVRNADKFEAMTISTDQQYMFMITAFNKYEPDDSKSDRNNVLLYKKLEPEGEEKIAYPSTRDSIDSSVKLRPALKEALRTLRYPDGPEVFKIEGLASLPGNILLIGVRAFGKTGKNPEFCVKIVGAKYKIEQGEFIFTEKLKEYYSFDPKQNDIIVEELIRICPNIEFAKKNLGLSSIEFDVFNNRLLILTSYEFGKNDTDVGAFLWMVDIKDFYKRKYPELLMTDKKTPLRFSHKAEGLTVLDRENIFVIHDDDKITGSDIILDPQNQFNRKLNQAAYNIVRIYSTEEDKNSLE